MIGGRCKTLPEAQRTQGIEFITWICIHFSTCISSKFDHQVMLPELVLQVRNWITFQLRSYRYDLSVTISCSKDKVMFETFKSISLKESAKEHANIEILLRDLDLAFHRPFCYGGLCSRRRWLLQRIILTKCLQQWWLISIYLCLW